jgi:predicted ATPase
VLQGRGVDRVEFGLVQVGLEHALLEVVEHDVAAAAAEVAPGLLVQPGPGLLAGAPDHAPEAAPRVAQRGHEQSRLAPALGARHARERPLPVVDLHLLTGQEGQAIELLGLAVAQLEREALDRVVGAGEAVLVHQILVDARTALPGYRDIDIKTVEIDCGNVGTADFNLSEAAVRKLMRQGVRAVHDCLTVKTAYLLIVDSKVVKLGALSVFIGNNGVGKSSLIEALETYQSIVREGLDVAMQRWFGIEHIRHKAQEAKERRGVAVNPIQFDIAIGTSPRKNRRLEMAVNNDPAANRMFIAAERISRADGTWIERDNIGAIETYGAGRSILDGAIGDYVEESRHVLDWQFLTLSPERMGLPVPQQRTGGRVRLARDGSNVADVLLDLRRQSPTAFEGVVEAMSYVLPYAQDIQPSLTSSEIERKSWLQMSEADFKVPGWLLSTGTLRMLALLALLRHPSPPPLIVVEEIENGLDPRSIHLIVEENRYLPRNGRQWKRRAVSHARCQ